MSALGMTTTVLATGLAEAVAKDDKDIEEGYEDCGYDLAAGMFGRHVSAWLREVAATVTACAEQAQALRELAACERLKLSLREGDLSPEMTLNGHCKPRLARAWENAFKLVPAPAVDAKMLGESDGSPL